MPILTKEVEVIPMGRSIPHYREKGYDVKHKRPLIVKVEDLPRGSDTKIEILCDMCLKNSMMVKYNDYNRVVENTGNYVCKECSPEKVRKNNLEKYGVPSVRQLESVKEKTRQTNLKNFGVAYPTQCESVKEKVKQSFLEHYGVSNYSKTEEYINKVKETNLRLYGVDSYTKSEECQEKMKKTLVDKYGVDSPFKISGVHEKIKKTCLKRYGHEFSSQSPEIKRKISQSLYKNGTTPTSKQQFYIFNLCKSINPATELNYPISYYNVDICFPEERVVIEYDGGFHNGGVKTGRITQKEFDQKEIVRNNIIKREGYKQIRVVSYDDKLPSDQALLRMLEQAKTYFSQYPHRSWIEFNVSTSTIRNAEHKQGIYHDFGVLRKIS